MSNPTITLITAPGGHTWIANSDEEVAHFSRPGQGHKIEVYTRVAPTEAAAMAATLPADLVRVHMAQKVGTEFEVFSYTSDGMNLPDGVYALYAKLVTPDDQAPVADQPANEDQKYWFRKGFEWAEAMGKPAPKGDSNG